MFGLFKRRNKPSPERKPRGVLPTYVTNDSVVLSKAAPLIRNAYEIRLALYMAKSRNLRFILAVRPQAQVEASLVALIKEHGGSVDESQLDDYSVYVGSASKV